MTTFDLEQFLFATPFIYLIARYVYLYRRGFFKNVGFFIAIFGVFIYFAELALIAKSYIENALVILSQMGINAINVSWLIFTVSLIVLDLVTGIIIKRFSDLPKENERRNITLLFYQPLGLAFVGFALFLVFVFFYLAWFFASSF